jgi:hypothetical protein
LMSGSVAMLAMLWLTASAFAGGWVVTTIDPLPPRMQAGRTYDIGFVMRQHGVTPIADATPQVNISLGDRLLSFPGKPDGPIGHYVAGVTFPVDGEWQWSVDQRPFPQTQSLGAVTILAAPAKVPQPVVVPAQSSPPVAAPEMSVPIAVAQGSSRPLATGQTSSPASVPALAPSSASGVVEMPTRTEAKPPAEFALLGLVVLAAGGVGLALLQVKRVTRPEPMTATAQMASALTQSGRTTITPRRA